jgi:hypothetical protein
MEALLERSNKAAVVIFARDPAGRVKTRLIPELGVAGARELHRACLQSTVRLAASLPRTIRKYLCLTSGSLRDAKRAALALGVRRGVQVRTQGSGDLGARLARMFAGLWRQGYARVVVIGSDSPTLTRRRLLEALAALRQADAVLGPARDGGYYLIGLRRTRKKRLFDGVAWGTANAFAQTRRNLQVAGLRVRLLPMGYDVDTPADLRRLRRELRQSRMQHLGPLRAWFLVDKATTG